jgi:hypothetical protein
MLSISSLVTSILGNKNSKSLLVALPCVALGWFFLAQSGKRKEPEEDNGPPIVNSDASGLQFVRMALSKEGPDFLLGLARDIWEPSSIGYLGKVASRQNFI